jgi:hypothetical protein
MNNYNQIVFQNDNIPNDNHQQLIVAKDDRLDKEQVTAAKERRSSIQSIMTDPHLTNDQRRHSIQILMDARRRSSFGSTFAEAAKNVAADFISFETNDGCSISCHDNFNSSDDDSFFTTKRLPVAKTAVDCANHSLFHCDENRKINTMKLKLNPMVAFTLVGEPHGNPKEMEESKPHCKHYTRNCSIISPCCGMVFGCRLCHDECETQEIPFLKISQKESIKNKANRDEASAAMGVAHMEVETSFACPEVTRAINSRFHQDSLSSSIAAHNKKEEVPSKPTSTGTKTNTKRPLSRRFSLSSIGEAVDGVHHDIDRYAIKEIICRKCYERQSSNS